MYSRNRRQPRALDYSCSCAIYTNQASPVVKTTPFIPWPGQLWSARSFCSSCTCRTYGLACRMACLLRMAAPCSVSLLVRVNHAVVLGGCSGRSTLDPLVTFPQRTQKQKSLINLQTVVWQGRQQSVSIHLKFLRWPAAVVYSWALYTTVRIYLEHWDVSNPLERTVLLATGCFQFALTAAAAVTETIK